jgi:predicted Ser/Thr protein kinase
MEIAMIDRLSDAGPPEDDPLDAGLRAGFGPEWTFTPRDGEGTLAAEGESGSLAPSIRLRDEPDEGPAGAVDPRPPGAAGHVGRYDVAGELARGGIGVVLKGRDRDLGRDVALKVLRAEHLADPAMVRRLIEEAQIGGQLQHPGVLPVYELGLDADRRPFFAMKLVRGRTLAELLNERDKPSHDRRRFFAIFEQVCQAVAYAHARGVIHRDLKPSNVMVGAFGEVQVVDWGLAKVLACDESSTGIESVERGPRGVASGPRSEDGSVLGTPAFMPPEQARGEVHTLDERCDVFALGAVLCEILAGQPPYVGSRDEILRQAQAGCLDDIFARLDTSGADLELRTLAKACLGASPESRPRDAGAVAWAMTAYLASADERARAAEREAEGARAVAASERRARRLAVAAFGLILAALSIGGVGSLWATRERARAAEAELRARAEQLRAEREFRSRIESVLQILIATEQKGQYLLLQAANVDGRDAARWADLMGTCRAVAERAAEASPDPASRRRGLDLAHQLRSKEAELRRRAGADAGDPRKN